MKKKRARCESTRPFVHLFLVLPLFLLKLSLTLSALTPILKIPFSSMTAPCAPWSRSNSNLHDRVALLYTLPIADSQPTVLQTIPPLPVTVCFPCMNNYLSLSLSRVVLASLVCALHLSLNKLRPRLDVRTHSPHSLASLLAATPTSQAAPWKWSMPAATGPKLRLHNSLTRNKVSNTHIAGKADSHSYCHRYTLHTDSTHHSPSPNKCRNSTFT